MNVTYSRTLKSGRTKDLPPAVVNVSGMLMSAFVLVLMRPPKHFVPISSIFFAITKAVPHVFSPVPSLTIEGSRSLISNSGWVADFGIVHARTNSGIATARKVSRVESQARSQSVGEKASNAIIRG